jgi:hypothetical protein
VLFCCSEAFVEKEVLPKKYIFIFFSLLSGVISLVRNSQSVQFDRLAISVFVFTVFILLSVIITHPDVITVLSIIGALLLFICLKKQACTRRLDECHRYMPVRGTSGIRFTSVFSSDLHLTK